MGEDEEKMEEGDKEGEEEVSGITTSPLLAIGPLLRFYTWIGAYPATISKDCRRFKVIITLKHN